MCDNVCVVLSALPKYSSLLAQKTISTDVGLQVVSASLSIPVGFGVAFQRKPAHNIDHYVSFSGPKLFFT